MCCNLAALVADINLLGFIPCQIEIASLVRSARMVQWAEVARSAYRFRSGAIRSVANHAG
jgi:hypothetical protein